MLLQEFRTEVVPAAERWDLWQDVASRTHLPNLLRSDDEDDFRATMRLLPLGDGQISLLTFPHLEIVRTPRAIRRFDPEVYQIQCLLKGEGGAAQDGREAAVHAGDLVLVDTSLPYEARHIPSPDPVSSVVVTLPRAMLPLPPRAMRRLVAVPVPLGHGPRQQGRHRPGADLLGRGLDVVRHRGEGGRSLRLPISLNTSSVPRLIGTMTAVSDFTELQLADGTLVRFQLTPGDAPAPAAEPVADFPEGMGHAVPVSRRGQAAVSFAVETLRSTLRPLGPFLQEVHDAVVASERPPQEVSVTFGVQVGHDLKFGIVGANGQAHLTVSATWQPAPAAD
jgi:hypothetical protein